MTFNGQQFYPPTAPGSLPPRQPASTGKKVALGCGLSVIGLFVMLIVIGAIGAALGGGADTATNTTSSMAPTSSTKVAPLYSAPTSTESSPSSSETTTPAPSTAEASTSEAIPAPVAPPVESTSEYVPAPKPTVEQQAPSAYYGSCREAKAAGAAPLYVGDPGYRPGLDGDGDGVACER